MFFIFFLFLSVTLLFGSGAYFCCCSGKRSGTSAFYISAGGCDPKNAVTRVIAALMKKEVATKLNWCGRGTLGKRAF